MKEPCEVAVLGAGPSGLTAALALARRGVAVTVVERRPPPDGRGFPGLDILHAARMGLLRELGAEEEVRAAAVPAGENMDVCWVSAPSLRPLHRFVYPRPRELLRAGGEAPARITRPRLLRVLWGLAEGQAQIRLLPQHECERLEPGADGVALHLRDAQGRALRLQASWVLACDGAESLARRTLGVAMQGPGPLPGARQLHFRVPDAQALQPQDGPAWHTQSGSWVLVDQDGQGEFSLHDLHAGRGALPSGLAGDELEHLARAMLREACAYSGPLEALLLADWTPMEQVADGGGAGRLWLAGDAAHQYAPAGGYGANTGMADGFELAAALAEVLGGGAETGLWEAAARRGWVARLCLHASLRHVLARQRIMALYAAVPPGLLEAATPRGERARERLGREIAAPGNLENEAAQVQAPAEYPAWLRAQEGEGEAAFGQRIAARFAEPGAAGLQPDEDWMRGGAAG